MKSTRNLKKMKHIKEVKQFKKDLLKELESFQEIKEKSKNIEWIFGKPIQDIYNE